MPASPGSYARICWAAITRWSCSRPRRTPGGHTNTVRVDTADETHHVDTGFIVFNDRNYPNFQRLLGAWGWRHSRRR